MSNVTRPGSYQPTIKWEEEALEVLHNGAEIRLDLDFQSSAILGALEAMILFCLGE